MERGCAGARISGVGRKGKHILVELASGSMLHIHLRMTGNLYTIPDVRFRAVTVRAYFELDNGEALVFEDSRVLGKIHLREQRELAGVLAGVGPEPHELAVADFVALAKASRLAAKQFLMDQKKVAGLGNIYAAEALFRAGVHPAAAMRTLTKPRLERLHAVAIAILEEAKQSAWEAYAEPGRFSEGENFPVQVYDREGEACFSCGNAIRRIAQGGRSTYFCATCQRRR